LEAASYNGGGGLPNTGHVPANLLRNAEIPQALLKYGAMIEFLQPSGWPSPSGYSNGVAARGKTIYAAGQVGWDSGKRFPSSLPEQVEQALRNIVAVLAEAGAKPEHLVRLTWFVADRQDYIDRQREVGAAYRRVIGRHYPAMSLVQVAGLLEPQALVEIEATAMIPD